MNPAFQQLAHSEMAAWQAAWVALNDLTRVNCDAKWLIAEAARRSREDTLARSAALAEPASNVASLPADQLRGALDTEHRQMDEEAYAQVDLPRFQAAFEAALASWDKSLMALMQEQPSDAEEIAQLLSRLAASEQEVAPDALKPEGALPVRPGTYRAWLRGPGGFEGVLRHIRAALIEVTGLEPGAQKAA